MVKKCFLVPIVCMLLVGCGTGDMAIKKGTNASEASVLASESGVTTVASSASVNMDSDSAWEKIEKTLGKCYAGVTDKDDEYAYLAFNKDKNWGILISYDATSKQNLYVKGSIKSVGNMLRITDRESKVAVTFEVSLSGKGSFILDMGDVGRCVVSEISPKEFVKLCKNLDCLSNNID